MRRYIADHPKGKDGIHRYEPEEFGVDPATVRREFAPYIERFGLEPEASTHERRPDERVPQRRCARGAPTSTASPLDVLQLDDVDDPRARSRARCGCVRSAIPLNLNDLERINGGNMMVRPDLPYSPGMESMGIVDACGDGRRGAGSASGSSRSPSRPTAASPSTRSARPSRPSRCPTTIPLPDAAALFFPFHLAWLGLFDRADLQAGRDRAHPRRRRRLGFGRDPARGRRRRARDRHRRLRREGAALPRPRRRDR